MPRKAMQPKFTDPRPLTERPLAELANKNRKTARTLTVNFAVSPLS